MKRFKTVDEYILGHPKWQTELQLLRQLLLNNDRLEEGVKWGAPIYTVNGKNVIGIGAFNSYVGLWFHQGVFLKDKSQVLINAQEGKTKALRQWRFSELKESDISVLKDYIMEAVQNQLAGKEVKPDRSSKINLPTELSEVIEADNQLLKQFNKLKPYKQKEYCEYIESAKRENTKHSRLEKIIPLILAGVGLNDKYRS